MSQKSKTEGVRTSLVLSEHASTVRRLVRVCVCSRNFEIFKIMKRQKPSGAQFKKKRKEEEEKRAKEKGKSLNPVLA